MFNGFTKRIARLFKDSLVAQTVAHFVLLLTVATIFIIATCYGAFRTDPVWMPPSDYARLKDTSSVEVEQQLKSRSPDLVGLVFFDKTKDVAILYKGFEQDKMVLDADVAELKSLAAAAGVPVSTKQPMLVGNFFENTRFYWYLIALGLLAWLVFFFVRKRDQYIPCRAVVACQITCDKVDQFRERNKWRKGHFYLTLLAVAGVAFILLSLSRVFHNSPEHEIPSEYVSQVKRTSSWQVERFLGEQPAAFERAVVVDGVNAVYLLIKLPQAPAKTTATDKTASDKTATDKKDLPEKKGDPTPAAANAAQPSTPLVEARLVRFGDSRDGQESFQSFVAALKAAKVPAKKAQAIVKSGWGATMPVAWGVCHGIFALAMLFSLFGILESWQRWKEDEVPPKAEKGATVGGGAVSRSIGNARIKAEDVKTLADVAGCDEAVAKFRLVAEWLRDAKAYQHFGAKLPKGVLLSGPPGTGKTLLARALAGEVGGNYFQAAASEFIEMYVGVGASRIRDLFGKAKAAHQRTGKPSIVFIDEIDAVGKPRSDTGHAGDGERDQTLNQLLTCIQGFDPNNGTLVIAATNRPETLDSALTRSGRFDYKITVDKPDRKGRKAIFAVHARKIDLEPGVDRDVIFDELARRSHDFCGADIELAINEAVTRAAKRNAPAFLGKSREEIAAMPRLVTCEDLHAGVDQVMYGELIKSKVRSDKERRATAIHEVGHAAVPTLLDGDPVTRITIVMTSKSLGLMESAPEEDRYGWSKEQFMLRIKTMLAGRIAEEEIGGEVSTGASNDFERASHLARAMVGVYGMSELGPISLPLDQHGFPRSLIGASLEAKFNDAWQKIISDCEAATKELIKKHEAQVRRVAAVLLEEETLTGDRFRDLWNMEEQSPAAA